MAAELNIVELIETNPVTKLSNTYNVKLLEKIKVSFTENEQQLFITSFYCYLNYDKEKDFVVDMDNVWKWLGFSTKQHCKSVLERHFKINIDYTEGSLTRSRKRSDEELIHEKGGQNKQKIMLTIKCFKSLCLKAQTELFDSCEEELKDKFNMRHGEFILYKDGAGQFDADNKLFQEFTSKYDCMTKLSICQKTFEKAFNKDLMYKGHYFRSMESRLFL